MPPSQLASELAFASSAALMPPGNCADVNCTPAGAAELKPKVTCGYAPAKLYGLTWFRCQLPPICSECWPSMSDAESPI